VKGRKETLTRQHILAWYDAIHVTQHYADDSSFLVLLG